MSNVAPEKEKKHNWSWNLKQTTAIYKTTFELNRQKSDPVP